MRTIKPEDLEKIIGYQKECDRKAAVTTTASFRLEALEELIKSIKGSDEYQEYEKRKLGYQNSKKEYDARYHLYYYHVCITFVREKTDEMTYSTRYTHISNEAGQVKAIGMKHCDGYSQLIPIITGCVCELDDKNKYLVKTFNYLQKDGLIPFVAPGGEGSGLIPPPPSGT